MIRLGNRLAFPIVIAALLALTVSGVASGWANTNSCGTTYKICVSRDDNNGVPRAVTTTTDSSYVDDEYYNNPDSINNSVSSMQNWYSSQDVIFHHDTQNNGTAMCVDSLYGYTSISLTHDDKFSSHALTVNDSAC
jgi:hypothetical protein